ncbi:MAG: hypothetical protein LQ346_008222, partial [Caloplaca aetnensis]
MPQRKRDSMPFPPLRPRALSLDKLLKNRQPTRASTLGVRAIVDHTSPAQAAVTSNGIVFAAPG